MCYKLEILTFDTIYSDILNQYPNNGIIFFSIFAMCMDFCVCLYVTMRNVLLIEFNKRSVLYFIAHCSNIIKIFKNLISALG